MTTVASAPGKIVLSGEYAVLDGAPAIVMAISRRARAEVTESRGGGCVVETAGFPAASDARFRVVEAACDGARPPLHFRLDTEEFAAQGHKIGIGSSAALTVAVVAAMAGSQDVFDAACDAHERLQGGSGSGVDVAAAVTGGLLEYRMRGREVRKLAWPDGLVLRVLWTGTPSSTPDKLARLAAAGTHASRDVLRKQARDLAVAWRTASASRVLDAYPAYIDALRRFGVDHGLGIFDAGHEQLASAAARAGFVYKPAGAGGGDVGVLLGTNASDMDTFLSQNGDFARRIVPCDVDPRGVTLESR